MSGVENIQIVDLPKMEDPRGSLTFIENSKHVPFDIKRVFYIYDVPTAKSRGAHAHRKLKQFLICLSGSFDVDLDDGKNKKTVHLNRPWQGLLVPSMIWAGEANFDPGTVCLVLTSDLYEESDYIRDYEIFKKETGASS
jgi:dTDP-4-dehydrorhamnose 3,5-epimerase-like enzyme